MTPTRQRGVAVALKLLVFRSFPVRKLTALSAVWFKFELIPYISSVKNEIVL
jgi:fumarate reductase subunit C